MAGQTIGQLGGALVSLVGTARLRQAELRLSQPSADVEERGQRAERRRVRYLGRRNAVMIVGLQ
jgi:hypothetical protein